MIESNSSNLPSRHTPFVKNCTHKMIAPTYSTIPP